MQHRGRVAAAGSFMLLLGSVGVVGHAAQAAAAAPSGAPASVARAAGHTSGGPAAGATVTVTATSTSTVTATATASATVTATTTATVTASSTATVTATTTASPSGGSTQTGAPGPNHAPTARAIIDPQVVYVDEPLHLDASRSTDRETDSDDLSYRWDFGDAGTRSDSVSARTVAHYSSRGLRTITLRVTDPQGLTDTRRFPVVVLRRVACENPAVQARGRFETVHLGRAPGGTYCDNQRRPDRKHPAGGQDSLSYVFAGTMLLVSYGTRADGGSAQVYIDGDHAGSISFHSKRAAVAFPRGYALFGGLKQSDHHRLRIVVDPGTGPAFIDSFSF